MRLQNISHCPAFIECLKNLGNFNRLYPLHFGTLFAVPDKIQLVKTLFKDFLNQGSLRQKKQPTASKFEYLKNERS